MKPWLVFIIVFVHVLVYVMARGAPFGNQRILNIIEIMTFVGVPEL